MPTTIKLKTKVFFSDLFGVLLGPDYSDLVNYIISQTGESQNQTYQKVFDEESMQFIRSEISFDQYFTSLQYKLEQGELLSREKFSYYWNQMKIGATPVVDELNRLSSKYNMYILTNTTSNHISQLKIKFDFIKKFDGIITSDRAKAQKPNQSIFKYAMNIANASPYESVFIDDSLVNVKAAAGLGMRSHQYINLKSLKFFLNDF